MKRIRIQNLWLNSFTVAAVIATIFVIAMPAVPATKGNTIPKLTVVKRESDTMTIDNEARKIRITATITKDCSKPSVCDWGRRGQALSGCIVCPSGCYGGIIADNSVPLLTTSSYFRFNWGKMPAPGSKVKLVLKSVYGKLEKKFK